MTQWDDCDLWTQSLLLAYDQIRQIEEAEELAAMMGARLLQ